MKKRINYRQLGRTSSHKYAMLRNLVTSLIEHERIVTTVAKAKEVQGLAEKLVTMAKRNLETNPVHARRQINKIVRTADQQTKLLNVLGPRYQFREGGYTRIMKLARPRAGDKADMAVIEYVDRPGEIRAARPPPALRMDTSGSSLQELMQKLGLEEQERREKEASSEGDAVVEESSGAGETDQKR